MPTPKAFDIVWIDAGMEPQCAPNPAYPNGIDIDASNGAEHTCVAELPYPAARIGAYKVTCNKCGVSAGCTTAGRTDDPRSLRLPCHYTENY